MKKLLSCFLALFLQISTNAAAAKFDQELCSKSDACKEYCQLRELDKYNENDSHHEEIMIQCTEDLAVKQSGNTDQMIENLTQLLKQLNSAKDSAKSKNEL